MNPIYLTFEEAMERCIQDDLKSWKDPMQLARDCLEYGGPSYRFMENWELAEVFEDKFGVELKVIDQGEAI